MVDERGKLRLILCFQIAIFLLFAKSVTINKINTLHIGEGFGLLFVSRIVQVSQFCDNLFGYSYTVDFFVQKSKEN